jgi:hypothetical protein
MRSYDEYKQILELWELGINKKAISRYTNIPRRTVIDCIQRFGTIEQLNQWNEENQKPLLYKTLLGEIEGDHTPLLETYAYLLGMYLGDGNIVKMQRIYRLRITLDAKYPNIIDSCMQAGKKFLPENEVGLVRRFNESRLSCVDVSIYHKNLPLFFPQHGDGLKHTRAIKLEAWQQTIVDSYPLEFFRGLYHSDGSRFNNVVNGKAYPRYQFSNTSTDIIRIFSDTCDRLGLHWTTKSRLSHHNFTTDVYISKRKDVSYLDSVIGAKS